MRPHGTPAPQRPLAGACPLLYEINTRCWLAELSRHHGGAVTLATVPDREFQTWRRLGFSHVWLMGVWEGGPRARAQALSSAGLRREFDQASPGWTEADVGPSPYAIAGYRVSPGLGGETALRHFRHRLNSQGLKLLLDFVPNHVGLDHPWADEHPDWFVLNGAQHPDFARVSGSLGQHWIAHGRDPFFPAWQDTYQLDYRLMPVRQAMTAELLSIATLCNGVRCDMSMLVLTDIFEKTWGDYPPRGRRAEGEFWTEAIRRVRAEHPGFLFLAEAYWGTETRLWELGFDYIYDKEVLDLMVAGDYARLLRRFRETPAVELERRARFLENHDEPRAAARFAPAELRACMLVLLALPGMRFLHQGQLQGATRRLPVQLQFHNPEPPDAALQNWYESVLTMLETTSVGRGTYLFPKLASPEPGAPTLSVFAIVWRDHKDRADLVSVNLSSEPAVCQLNLEELELGSGLPFGDWKARPLFPDCTPPKLASGAQPGRWVLQLQPWSTLVIQLQVVGNL